MNINSFMTPRLLTVAELVKKSYAVADIGTDHAYVPAYLILSGKCEKALAMDINNGPLLRAEENIKKFSLESRISTRLSDGLKNISNGEVDTVIIAGMGGILINNIIENDIDRLTSVKQFVLQPMTAVEETRKYLSENGFMIEDERLAKEGDKIYTVISAVPGKMEIEKEIYFYIGKSLIKNKDKFLPELIDGKIYEYEKAVNSIRNTKNETAKKRAQYFIELLTELKEMKKECAKWQFYMK